MTAEEIIPVLEELNYKVVKIEGQCIEALSVHKWDMEADKPISISGERKLNINIDKDYIFMGIREDGYCRTAFNGYIETPTDIRQIDKLTKIM